MAQARQLAREHRPQLGLLDLSLPDGDGVELAGRSKADGLHFPLILVTAYPLRLHGIRNCRPSSSRVLTKPLNLQELRPGGRCRPRQRRDGPGTYRPRSAVQPRPATLHDTEPLARPASVAPAPGVSSRRLMWAAAGIAAALLLVGVLVAGPSLGLPSFNGAEHESSSKPQEPKSAENRTDAKLVEGMADAIEVPEDVVTRLGIETRPVELARWLQPLELGGSLALDTDKLQIVRSRFPGEVMAIGTLQKPGPNVISKDTPITFSITSRRATCSLSSGVGPGQ